MRFPNFTWFDVQSGVRVVEIRMESGFKRNIPFDYLEIYNLFIIQKMNTIATIVINIIAAFGRMMNVLVS